MPSYRHRARELLFARFLARWRGHGLGQLGRQWLEAERPSVGRVLVERRRQIDRIAVRNLSLRWNRNGRRGPSARPWNCARAWPCTRRRRSTCRSSARETNSCRRSHTRLDGHFVDLGLTTWYGRSTDIPRAVTCHHVVALGTFSVTEPFLSEGHRLGALIVEPHARAFHRAAVVDYDDPKFGLDGFEHVRHEGCLARLYLDLLRRLLE